MKPGLSLPKGLFYITFMILYPRTLLQEGNLMELDLGREEN